MGSSEMREKREAGRSPSRRHVYAPRPGSRDSRVTRGVAAVTAVTSSSDRPAPAPPTGSALAGGAILKALVGGREREWQGEYRVGSVPAELCGGSESVAALEVHQAAAAATRTRDPM